MVSTFIGRKHELEIIGNIWAASKPSLFILYGRRRIGKTRLLTHWLKEHEGEGFYWMAEAISALDQLRSFSQALADFETPDMPAPSELTLPSWEYALRKAARLAQDRRMVLFIDEVTYLMDVTPTFIPTLQKVWDHWLSKSNMMLGLSGSQMGLMQKKLLSYDAPLYGRATAHIKLEPLPFGATGRFFPDYTPEERVMVYAIWGGVPAYWERLDSKLSINENLRRQLLPSNTWMLDESRLLLQDFINDPHNYVGIMRAIAQGDHTFSGIGRRTGMSTGHTSRYLNILRDTGFVARRIPVTDINVPDSRRGRYVVTDPYLRFYYRYVAAYQSKLALGKQEQLMTTIKQDLPALIQASTWPEMCQNWLLLASAQGVLPVSIEDVGGEWKRTFSIDVAGISEIDKTLVLGTCHWEEDAIGIEEVESLLSHTRQIIPESDDNEEWKIYYIGFSARGWTAEAKAKAEKSVINSKPTRGKLRWQPVGIRLLDLSEVDANLQEWY